MFIFQLSIFLNLVPIFVKIFVASSMRRHSFLFLNINFTTRLKMQKAAIEIFHKELRGKHKDRTERITKALNELPKKDDPVVIAKYLFVTFANGLRSKAFGQFDCKHALKTMTTSKDF